MAEIRPNSKGHCVIITRRHIKDVREMNAQEWADLLSVLKDTINKINKVYSPAGMSASLPIGKKGTQNQMGHFYCRVVPKYKEGYGKFIEKEKIRLATPQEHQETKKLLQANQKDIVAERSRAFAKLEKVGDYGG